MINHWLLFSRFRMNIYKEKKLPSMLSSIPIRFSGTRGTRLPTDRFFAWGDAVVYIRLTRQKQLSKASRRRRQPSESPQKPIFLLRRHCSFLRLLVWLLMIRPLIPSTRRRIHIMPPSYTSLILTHIAFKKFTQASYKQYHL